MFDIQKYFTTHKPKNGRFFTVAIDGRGAAGKTALDDHLRPLLPGFLFMRGDDYFEPIEHPILWGGFNDQRFEHDVIEPLKTGTSFTYRPYDWHTDPHITEQHMTIKDGFLLERCFSFAVGLDWDLKIWIETPKEVCLERGVARDTAFRNPKALEAWRDIWQPDEDSYIARIKPLKTADLVLDGTKPFAEQVG